MATVRFDLLLTVFLTRPKPLLGRVLVIGSSKKKKQEELFINFQPIVSKCCASEVQCLAVLAQAPGP